MGLVRAYMLRLARKRRQLRAWRSGRRLALAHDNTKSIGRRDVLLFCTVRNEIVRLPYFLEYYRRMGVNHFLFVDNGSDDGTSEFLANQTDCSVWHTDDSYRRAKFGVDWMNWLLGRHGHGHWVLVVDVDEFLVFAHSDTRPIQALTDWLDASSIKSFSAMLLDLYSDQPVEQTRYNSGEDPIAAAPYFDGGNYTMRRNKRFGNLWIQGGPRQRVFFADKPNLAPALNKIPLVRWQRSYVFVSSTHSLLPRGLNLVYEEWGGEKPSGVLLHTKFLDILSHKAEEELTRKQHYAASREYRAYKRQLGRGRGLWSQYSERYRNWRQLEKLGLMSSGGWL